MFHLNCGHNHCRGCIRQAAKYSIKDRELVPLKCSNDYIFEDKFLQNILNTKELQLYLRIKAEKNSQNKMYCPKDNCSEFINIENLNKDEKFKNL